MTTFRKFGYILAILIVLLPLGILGPRLFNSGGAWGEWSVKEVKQQTGQEPAGMKKNATLYHAPLPGYNQERKNDSLAKRLVRYIISGLIGTGIILLITFGVAKITTKKTE